MQVHAVSKPATTLPQWQVFSLRLAAAAALSIAMPTAQASGLRVVESLGMSYLPSTTWVIHQGEPSVTFSMYDGMETARFDMSFDGSAFHLKALNDNVLASMPSLPWALCLYPLTGDVIPPGQAHSTNLGSIAWFEFPTGAGNCVDIVIPRGLPVPEPSSLGLLASGGLALLALSGRRARAPRS